LVDDVTNPVISALSACCACERVLVQNLNALCARATNERTRLLKQIGGQSRRLRG
jgi:hypothetical protein